jgi:hypothetical protein
MKPNIICSVYHDIRQFTWKKTHDGYEGSAELSDLGLSKIFCPVYNDACDEGFGIRGVSRDIVFAIDHSAYNREDELEYYVLKSISEPGFTVILFND